MFQSTTKSENFDLADKLADSEKRYLEVKNENIKLIEELNAEKQRINEFSDTPDEFNSELMAELSIIKVIILDFFSLIY